MTLRLSRWMVVAIAVILLALVFAAGGAAGYIYAAQATPSEVAAVPGDSEPKSADPDKELWKPFWETYDLINKEFYGRPVDKQELVYSAAEGMIKSLDDPYTSFLRPRAREQLREEMSGRFEGIGVYVDFKDNLPVIVTPIDGSPAEKAGLERGDIILEVNGEDISQMEQAEVINKIRGPKGTTVTLTIKRGKQKPFEVDIVRDEIKVKQVSYELVEGDIAYIRATIFGDNTTRELDEALGAAQEDGARGIILDLRDNGGGWVHAAREMVGRFVPKGVAMYEDFTRGPGGERSLDLITGEVNAFDTPMVVLVNKGTASASEIVAGALQAHDRAELVGDVTFGKGSEQRVHDLSAGASTHITVAHWLTPDKRDIHGEGLDPDYLVKSGKADDGPQGPQFDKAVERLRVLLDK